MLILKLWLKLFLKVITHGSHPVRDSGRALYHTTRWHRKIRRPFSRWYHNDFKDWFHKRTYVPLLCMLRNEVRVIRWDSNRLDGGFSYDGRGERRWSGAYTRIKVRDVLGQWCLPPGIYFIEDLPQLPSANACYEYAHEQWVEYQA